MPAEFTQFRQILSHNGSPRNWKSYWATEKNDINLNNYLSFIYTISKELENTNSERVFLVADNRAYFLAGLLAILYAKKTVVIPQHSSAEILSDLMDNGDILISDNNKNNPYINLGTSKYDVENSFTFKPLDANKAKFIFYTSGSTGKPKAIEKYLFQIEAELKTLHNLWASKLANCSVLSTVPHHHIYGLIFSLLWPVCEGYHIHTSTYSYWEDLLSEITPNSFIISSPSHLSRIPVNRQLENCTIFSSAGPLTYEASNDTLAKFGVRPIEIFGSTETGGIAYRQQSSSKTPWLKFACVKFSVDKNQLLSIRSDYLVNSDCYQTSDRILHIDDEHFYLLGRADRIVKVEGKRISLIEIERKINSSPYVKASATISLNSSTREEIGAVIVLNNNHPKENGEIQKKEIVSHLKVLLSPYIERVAIPRKWRFIDKIPMTDSGKVLNEDLKQLFKR